MPISRPFRRTCRQFLDGQYFEGGRWGYMVHPAFAHSPEHYVRAFQLIQKDLQDLFDYLEPADKNLNCYSFRIHALLLRACVEVEANCRAILLENGFAKSGDMTMTDYRKINSTHRLSAYQVKLPIWTGSMNLRTPFGAWDGTGTLQWYRAYNASKHDRRNEFETATFDHLIDAVCGLLVLLSAQFGTNDFSPGPTLLATEGPGGGFEHAIGGYFQVRFPQDWPEADRYDFDWQKLANESDPFQKMDYTKIA